MKANLEFQKALLLLDFGKLDKGLEKLKNVIVQAENENDIVTLVQSLVCIGDLCIELELFQDAIFYLNRALSYHHDNDDDDDVLKCEMYRANELLNVASKNLHYN